VSTSVPYTGGNGGYYLFDTANCVSSTGVTGLTACPYAEIYSFPIISPSFQHGNNIANGSGALTYTITGTPSGSGTATFALSLGGQSCTLTRTVTGTDGSTGTTLHTCGAPNIHNPDLTYGSMTDQQGNVYKTIVIGTQEWMAENLNTSIYRNGDAIPTILDNATWQNTTSGAWVYYNNDPSYACPFGKLYNWYACVDARQLCPVGWHVPTDAEWTILTNYLGGSDVAGGKMKTTGTIEAATGLWYSPNQSATNSSGFSGAPGGYRSGYLGVYYDVGYSGWWWSSSEIDSSNARERNLNYLGDFVDRGGSRNHNGFSVRCLRD
jgi:uncharacterized protein (TIGR02145 family)